MEKNTSGPEVSYLRSFLVVSQSSILMDASIEFPLQERLLQSKFNTGRLFTFPYPNPVCVRVWTHMEIFPYSDAPQSSSK